MVNWTVRFRNPLFWVAVIPACLLLVQAVLAVFGVDWDYSEINSRLLAVVEAAFSVLAIIGVVADPTTDGVSDSIRALHRQEPGPNVVAEMAEPVPEEERVDFDDVKRKYEGNHANHFTGGDDDRQ